MKASFIKETLPSLPIVGQKISEMYAFFYVLHKVLSKGGIKKIDKTIMLFKPDTADDQEKLRTIRKRLIRNGLRYKIGWDEYFLFGFENLSSKQKREFVGDPERIMLGRRASTYESRQIFQDKYQCYKKFQLFFNRGIILIQNQEEFGSFSEFCRKHKRVVVKPLLGHMGIGTYISSVENGIEVEWKKVLSIAPCVVEELIENHDSFSQFHPKSLNTVRYATYLNGKKNGNQVIPLFSFVRFGVGESVVDNAGSGGILASVDVNTGRVKTDGVDEMGHVYTHHPNSELAIRDFRIPKWEELTKLADSVARIVPEQKYVGWDFALDKSGKWVLIEGNTGGQFLHQYAERMGCREMVKRYFN